MKVKSSKTLLYLALIAGLVLLGLGAYKYLGSRSAAPAKENVALKLYGVRKHDQEVLSAGTAEAKEIARSLKRYASQNLPGAEDYIKYYLKDSREEVVIAALEAAGAFKWAELDLFANALSEGSVEAQKASLEGLAKRPSAERSALVEEYLQKAKPDDLQLMALIALAKMQTAEEEKGKIKSRIFAFVANKPADLKLSGYKAIFSLYPRDPQLVVQAEKILERDESTQLTGAALRYVQNDPSDRVKSRFSKLSLPKDYESQMIAIDFIRQNCPPGWQKVLAGLAASASNPRTVEESKRLEESKVCK